MTLRENPFERESEDKLHEIRSYGVRKSFEERYPDYHQRLFSYIVGKKVIEENKRVLSSAEISHWVDEVRGI